MVVKGARALEVWARRVTEGYPNVRITDMSGSWRDGLAFCAILHRFRPNLIDFLSLDPAQIERNCSLVFDIAERELDIPALLDPADMAACTKPDRLSILTYLAEFYHKFKHEEETTQPFQQQQANNEDIAEKILVELTRKDSCDSGVSISPISSGCNSPPPPPPPSTSCRSAENPSSEDQGKSRDGKLLESILRRRIRSTGSSEERGNDVPGVCRESATSTREPGVNHRINENHATFQVGEDESSDCGQKPSLEQSDPTKLAKDDYFTRVIGVSRSPAAIAQHSQTSTDLQNLKVRKLISSKSLPFLTSMCAAADDETEENADAINSADKDTTNGEGEANDREQLHEMSMEINEDTHPLKQKDTTLSAAINEDTHPLNHMKIIDNIVDIVDNHGDMKEHSEEQQENTTDLALDETDSEQKDTTHCSSDKNLEFNNSEHATENLHHKHENTGEDKRADLNNKQIFKSETLNDETGEPADVNSSDITDDGNDSEDSQSVFDNKPQIKDATAGEMLEIFANSDASNTEEVNNGELSKDANYTPPASLINGDNDANQVSHKIDEQLSDEGNGSTNDLSAEIQTIEISFLEEDDDKHNPRIKKDKVNRVDLDITRISVLEPNRVTVDVDTDDSNSVSNIEIIHAGHVEGEADDDSDRTETNCPRINSNLAAEVRQSDSEGENDQKMSENYVIGHHETGNGDSATCVIYIKDKPEQNYKSYLEANLRRTSNEHINIVEINQSSSASGASDSDAASEKSDKSAKGPGAAASSRERFTSRVKLRSPSFQSIRNKFQRMSLDSSV